MILTAGLAAQTLAANRRLRPGRKPAAQLAAALFLKIRPLILAAGVAARSPILLFSAVNVLRFGKIGRLPADLIADLHFGALKGDALRPADQWIVKGPDERISNEEAGRRAGLLSLNLQSHQSRSLFEKQTQYYHLRVPLWTMSCALTFDLTAAHYWGKLGIPINIRKSDGRLWYINDFVSVGYLATNVERTRFSRILVTDTAVPRDSQGPQVMRPLFAKSQDGELSLARQFSLWANPTLASRTSSEFRFFDFEDNPTGPRFTADLVDSQRFVHIVEPLPPEENNEMEPYHERQLFLSEGAAVRHPLRLLLFYHYDPRIHFRGGDAGKQSRVDELARTISLEHSFLNCRFDPAGPPTGGSVTGKIFLTPDGELNSFDNWRRILAGALHSNESVFDRLLRNQNSQTGIYWGIKIYPRLGYDPAGFREYPQLEELYGKLQDLEVPMVSHCSEGGMAIADYLNYVRYGGVYRDFSDWNPVKCDLAFANAHASPQNWKNALFRYPRLKLCLAHFGGFDVWKEVVHKLGDFRRADTMYDAGPDGVPADKWAVCLTYNRWVRSIVQMIDERITGSGGAPFVNLYTDMAYFNMHEDTRGLVVDNLEYLLLEYPKLRDRLLLGSDWYILEDHELIKGNGEYQGQMFLAMRELSARVGYDAWHQFGIINQLRFLGLLDERGGRMNVDVQMMRGYVERLKALSRDGSWLARSFVSDGDIAEIDPRTHSLFSWLSMGTRIKRAEEMISDEGRLLITYENPP
jgi:hypothetical protein